MKNEKLNLYLSFPEKRDSILEEIKKSDPELAAILIEFQNGTFHDSWENAIKNFIFENLNIKEIDYLIFRNCEFLNCTIGSVDCTVFENCKFSNCAFVNEVDGVYSFTYAQIIQCTFEDISFQMIELDIKHIMSQYQDCIFKRADVSADEVDYDFLKLFSGIGSGLILNSQFDKDDDLELDFSKFSFENCHFSGFDFANSNIRFSDFNSFGFCSFDNSDLSGSTLYSDEYDDSRLGGVDLSSCKLIGCFTIYDDVNLEYADLREAEIAFEGAFQYSLRGVRLNPKGDTDFLDMAYDLSEVDFEDWILCEFNFEDKIMENVNFKNADLQEANFRNCDLTGSDFSGAILDGADFTGAILTKVIFEGASLEGTIFEKCIDDFEDCFRDNEYNELEGSIDLDEI